MLSDYVLSYFYGPANAAEASHMPVGPRDEDAALQTETLQLEIQSLRAALQDREREVERWRKKAEDAAQCALVLEADLAEASGRCEADQVDAVRWIQEAEKQVSEAEHRAKLSETAFVRLSRELQQSQAELQKTTTLLDTRSAELRDAQAYLSRLDDVADTEVLQLINGINSRIFQAAASIADTFQWRYNQHKDAQSSQEAAARLRDLLGDDLLLALGSIHHADDPLIVQTVLQTMMVSQTRWLCTTWDFHPGDRMSSLQHAYHSIRHAEPQSVAGRWRALSRTYLKRHQDSADPQRIASDVLLDHTTDILLASGIAAPRQDIRKEVQLSYADALREIVHLALEFRCITGERIISRDFLVVTANPGKPFDPSCMIDEWADPKRGRYCVDVHPVLCTIQLGLVREERKADEGMCGEVGIAKVVLLKPKVALTSLLEELCMERTSS